MRRTVWYYTVVCVLLIWVGACKENEKSKKPFVYFENYQRTFNDLNDRHLASAKRLGITPLKSSEDLSKADRNLKEIKSCKLFQVDKLTHSEPYLVPEACDLLADIARNFKDSLYQKGLPSHSIVVTSVLRTGSSVKDLRKSNGNASVNSAHVYGTTFDVAYTRFKKDGCKEAPEEKLKSVLADVLQDLRLQKKCYVRYEFKQGCFHITTR